MVIELTQNERLALAVEMTLEGGPMSWTARRADHVRWLDETFGNGLELLRGIAATTPASTCAICVGMWAMLARIQDRRGKPKALAITTWAGFGGFGGRFWIPRARLTDVPVDTLTEKQRKTRTRVRRGDVPYWCGGTEKTWYAATNGHVGVTLVGEGFSWVTGEGGGGSDGTSCRKSDAPKDIRKHGTRLLRGVWRPDGADSEDVTESPPAPSPPWRSITPGMYGENVREWQKALLRWRPDCLPRFGADGVYGKRLDSETLLATRAFQTARGLPDTGIVDQATWYAGGAEL